jgi:NAD(P)-dependent dehydrogenase (short-subunit alcohol dehydrogenase family)
VVASARKIKPGEDPDVLAVEGDLAEPATANRIVDGALERFGRIDTLVNNAGVYISKPFTDYTAADYALASGVNLAGFFWITQRAIAEMATRNGGHQAESYQDLGSRLPPLGRAGQVSDVVDAILFLESSPYITGEILHVDGGQTAGH